MVSVFKWQKMGNLKKDVDWFDGHDLKDVVCSGEDSLKPELDDRTNQVKKFINLLAEQFRQNLKHKSKHFINFNSTM